MSYCTSNAPYSSAFSIAYLTDENDQTQSLILKLKVYLGLDIVDNSLDEDLNCAIVIALSAVETYLDRVLVKREITEYFPHHFGTVVLHNLPADLSEPITVLLDGAVQSDYKAFLGRGKLCHLSRTGMRPDMPMDWRGYEQVEVTYTAGYDPLPDDVAQALVYTAGALYQSNGTGTMPSAGSEVRSMTIHDVGTISYATGQGGSMSGGYYPSPGMVPDMAAQMLTRHKRIAA